MTQAAQTAKLIRAELKAKFYGIKFKVQSENFSMGDSVNVYYDAELTNDQHERLHDILAKYQYGSFNGMEDIYEYDNRNDHAQAKFVHANKVTDLSRY